jgi:hypothetical protein
MGGDQCFELDLLLAEELVALLFDAPLVDLFFAEELVALLFDAPLDFAVAALATFVNGTLTRQTATVTPAMTSDRNAFMEFSFGWDCCDFLCNYSCASIVGLA